MKECMVAVVQASPVLFDKQATVDKACALAREAAAQGAELVLFPESFVPAYPRGLRFGSRIGSRSEVGRDQWLRYWEASMDVPGPECAQLAKVAEDLSCWLVIGVTERAGGSLYCSMLYFSPEGKLAHKHRKLKPTAAERIVWAEGDGRDLQVLDIAPGKTGGLICWENYMPLARAALYAQGIEVYLAPTADQRDSWQQSLGHIAREGRCYVLGANQVMHKSDYPADFPGLDDLDSDEELICRGGSVILDPMGEPVAGPLWNTEGILTARLDPASIVRARLDFDAFGHYSRQDVFRFGWPGRDN